MGCEEEAMTQTMVLAGDGRVVWAASLPHNYYYVKTKPIIFAWRGSGSAVSRATLILHDHIINYEVEMR